MGNNDDSLNRGREICGKEKKSKKREIRKTVKIKEEIERVKKREMSEEKEKFEANMNHT